MKVLNPLKALLSLGLLALASACGSNNPQQPTNGYYNGNFAGCAPGQYCPQQQQFQNCQGGLIPTQAGCAQPAQAGQCPQNGQTYGFINNQCLPMIQQNQFGGQFGTQWGNQWGGQYPYPNYQYQGMQNQCAPGMVMTQYNCLPQGTCPPNHGQIGGGCVPGLIYQQPYNQWNTGWGGSAGFYYGWGR